MDGGDPGWWHGPAVTGPMHADEIPVDAALVGHLIATQHPRWAGLPIEPVPSTGTDNALYRLGPDLLVRLPRRPAAAPSIGTEQRWLPALAPHLPLPIPVPRALGVPSPRFPWPWSVYPWFDGQDAATASPDPTSAARDLARFLAALRRVDPRGGPEPGPANFGRGQPLAARDRLTRDAIAASAHLIDGAAVTTAWEHALEAPPHDGPPVWLHGDLASGNLIVAGGRIRAVIDWSAAAVGDPACDLLVAWELFDEKSRAVFRRAVAADDASWARGRGWALSTAVVALHYYQDTSPFMVAQARRKLAAVLGYVLSYVPATGEEAGADAGRPLKMPYSTSPTSGAAR